MIFYDRDSIKEYSTMYTMLQKKAGGKQEINFFFFFFGHAHHTRSSSARDQNCSSAVTHATAVTTLDP